ncbi:MAG: hypothetical protein ACRCTX_26350 [Afipia sp.]
MAKQNPVTERDLRMPEFRHLNAEDLDDYEFREDGKIVRKDRWENAIRRIRSALGDPRREFEIDEVVSAVRALVASIEPQGDRCDFCGAGSAACDDCSGYDNYIPIQIEPPKGGA